MNETVKAIGRWSAQLLVGIFAGVVSLVVIATLVLRLIFPEDELKELVLDLVNEGLRGEVSLGSVFISPLVGVVARDLVVLSSEEFGRVPAVRLDEFTLRYDLDHLLSDRRITLEVAEARGMDVNLIEIPGLGWNIEHLVVPTEEEKEPFTWDSIPVEVQLRRLSVRELNLTVNDGISASLGGVSLILSGFDTGNPGPVEIWIQKEPGPVSLRLVPVEAPSIAGRIDELALNLRLSIPEDPLTAQEAAGDFYIAASGINLSAPLEFAPAGGLILQGSFNADIVSQSFTLTQGRLTLGDYLSVGMELAATIGEEPRLALDLRIENAELSPLVRDLHPVLPDLSASGGITGKMDLDVRLSESLVPEEAAVEAELNLTNIVAGMVLPTGPARVVGLDGEIALDTTVKLDNPTPTVNLSAELSLLSAEQGPYSAGNLTLTAGGTVDLGRMATEGFQLDLTAGYLSSTGEAGPLLVSDVALTGIFTADLGRGDFTVDGLKLDLADTIHWSGGARIRDFARGGVVAELNDLEVDLGSALALIPPGMVELPPVKPTGRVRLNGRIEVAPGALDNPDPLVMARSLRAALGVELTEVSVGTPQGGADNVNGHLTLDFDSGTGDLELTATVGRVVLADLPIPVEGVGLKLKGHLENLEEFHLKELDARVDSLDFNLTGKGAVSDLMKTPIVALDLQGRVGRIGHPLKASEGIADVEGQVGVELSLRGGVQGPKPMWITGRIRLHQINFYQAGGLAVTGIEGELPIDVRVVLSDPLPLPGGAEGTVSPFADRRYELLAPFTPPPDLIIEEVRIAGQMMRDVRVEDLELTWAVSGGGLHVWRLGMGILGGSLVGKLNLQLTEEVPAFDLQLEFSDLNVGHLIEGVEPTEESEINGDLRLRVRGSDLSDLINRFEVEGSINITRIGKEVLDKMLLFLDPEGTNPSITQVRGLLGNIQKKPELVTMEIKNQRMTMKIRTADTGYSLLALFTSFIDLSEFTIPRIPIADILRSSLSSILEEEKANVLESN
ncbi:hypothetical protein KAU45_09915 [bacterium]|nr:hypothetical protein [bacterium]